MAWSTPETFTSGQTLTASSMNAISDNLTEVAPFMSAWTDYAPTVTQSSSVANTATVASYIQIGKLVIATFRLDITASGTSSNTVTVTLPVTAANTLVYVGAGAIFDSSASTNYEGMWINASTTAAQLAGDWSGQNAWGTTPTTALASGDAIRGMLIYEAA